METAQHVPPRRWLYAGVDWECAPQRTDVATGFCGAEIAVNDPVGMAKTWAFGLGAQLGADGTSILLGIVSCLQQAFLLCTYFIFVCTC